MKVRSLIANANKNRIQHTDQFWNDKKKNFAIAVGTSFVLIQLLFLGLMSYLYGSVYRDSTRVHNLNVLLVDYDGGVVGQSLRQASTALSGDDFPTIIEKPVSQYVTQNDVVHAVWEGSYWAAIFSVEGASQRLSAALSGGQAASAYNASDTIVYVYNEARYPTVAEGYILANMQSLGAVTRQIYNSINGSAAFRSINQNSDAAIQVLLNPIATSSINVKPTPQATKVLYNTVSMVMPIIMQFFFLMAVNGVAGHFSLYSHLPLKDNGIIRFGLSTVYTMIGALCHIGYQSAFFESHWLSPTQFVLCWLTVWLYMHINFLFIDCLTAFVPMVYLSFFFFSWVILNITSVVMPFELNPGFYRWGYALPAHQALQLLITVWSDGGVNSLKIALPVLFTWEVVLIPLAVLGLHYRCGVAAHEYNANESAMRERYGRPEAVAKAKTAEEVKATEDSDQDVAHDKGAVVPDAQDEAPMAPIMTSNQYFPSTPLPLQNTLQRITSITSV